MCGRIVSASGPDELARYFSASLDTSPVAAAERLVGPRYNVAPGSELWTVLQRDGARRLVPLRWGLVPGWADGPEIGHRLVNARAERLAESRAYRDAFRHRRCLVPVDGFYEWRRVPGAKHRQPYYVHRPDGEPMALAGLWASWGAEEPSSGRLETCAIVTGAPNEAVAEVHDRMPVILPPAAWARWLDQQPQRAEWLTSLLVPAPSSVTALHPVSTAVNDADNEGPELLEPREVAREVPLFELDDAT